MNENTGYQRFAHPKNIANGKGRVMWADATRDCTGRTHEAGWVLPGGIRTQDEATARAVAVALNEMAGD
ncbi:MAG: hypothetical protein ACRYGA_02255 [Janthinobacterium lividum]